MIAPITALGSLSIAAYETTQPVGQRLTAAGISFEEMLRSGINATNTKIAKADALVTVFAVDDDIPAHHVMFALEEARLSLEMMVQVRNRLVEGYQQIMNMQV